MRLQPGWMNYSQPLQQPFEVTLHRCVSSCRPLVVSNATFSKVKLLNHILLRAGFVFLQEEMEEKCKAATPSRRDSTRQSRR